MSSTTSLSASVHRRGLRLLVALMLVAVTLLAPLASRGASPSRTFLVQDTFTRDVASGWAPARTGTYRYPRGTNGMSVDHGSARLVLRPGATRAVEIAGVNQRDVDVRFLFALDGMPVGEGVVISTILRRDGHGNQYRARLRVTRDGAAWLSIIRARNGEASRLGVETRVRGLRIVRGERYWLRTRIRGVAATHVDARIWRSGTRQPSRWTVARVDRRAPVAARGRVGVRVSLAPDTGASAVTLHFDELRVRRAQSLAEVATVDLTPRPTAKPTRKPPAPDPTARPAPTDDAGPTDAPTPSPSPSPRPTAEPTDAPTPSPSPSPRPTAEPTPRPSPSPRPTAEPTPRPTPQPTADPSGSLYVATNGDDTSSGTGAKPFRTLQKAVSTVAAGGTILVRPGRYAGFTMTRSGSQSEPIIIRAASGRPVIDGALNDRLDVIKISGAHDIHIAGFEITGAQGGNYSGAGIRTENGATRIVIEHDLIHENHSFGVHANGSTAITISDNDIHHNEVGVQVNGAGQGTRILDNDIHANVYMLRNTPKPQNAHDDAGAAGIVFLRSTGAVIASGNRVWGNRASSYDYDWDGSAFEIYGASNVTISDNVAWDNENVLETGTDRSGPQCSDNVFARNVAYGATTAGRSWGMFLRCAADMTVANNTFHELDGFVFSIGMDSSHFSGSIGGLRVINNIVSVTGTGAKIFGLTTSLPDSVSIDHNLARTSGSYASLADGRSTRDADTFTTWTGYQAHAVNGSPQFVDGGAHDYHLKSGSPAIDAGVRLAGVSDSWSGSAPDLGRYERAP